jgi:hypothetical protein
MIKVGFSTRSNIVSKTIRWATHSRVSHAWLLLEGSFFGNDMVMEATEGGFKLVPYSAFKLANDVVDVITPRVSIESGVRASALWLGEGYDYFGLFGEIFVLIGRWFKRKIRNPLAERNAMFCSEAVVYVLQASSYPGANTLVADSTSPEDLLEFLKC